MSERMHMNLGERHPKCQKCCLCQVLCLVTCLHIHYFWRHDLSKLKQNLLIPARPSTPKNTSTDYSKHLPLCKWWPVIVTRYWFTAREVQARRDARPISLLWDRHSLLKMSDLERFGGKGVPVLTLEAVAQALGKREILTGFILLKGSEAGRGICTANSVQIS